MLDLKELKCPNCNTNPVFKFNCIHTCCSCVNLCVSNDNSYICYNMLKSNYYNKSVGDNHFGANFDLILFYPLNEIKIDLITNNDNLFNHLNQIKDKSIQEIINTYYKYQKLSSFQ